MQTILRKVSLGFALVLLGGMIALLGTATTSSAQVVCGVQTGLCAGSCVTPLGGPGECEYLVGGGQTVCECVPLPPPPLLCEDPDPRTQGFWRRVCKKDHPDQPDRSILTPELCEDLNPDPHSDPCGRARSQFAALLYNIASDRLQEVCIDDNTGYDIGVTVDAIEVLLAAGTNNSCKAASDLAVSINEGNVSIP